VDDPLESAWLRPYRRLTIEPRHDGDRLVLHARGEIDINSVGALERALEGSAAESVSEVVVDLTEVDFMDSTGLTALLTAKRNGVPGLALVCPPGPVRRVLEVAGFNRLLPIRDGD
jgi:anti-sigma B factor antagonist